MEHFLCVSFFVYKPKGSPTRGEGHTMESAQALRFISNRSVALRLPIGSVITALLETPIEESEFQRLCASVCATNPMPVEVQLGEYSIEGHAFTGCMLRFPSAPVRDRRTKFRRIEGI